MRSCSPPPPLLHTCCSYWRYTMSAPKRLFKCCVLGCTSEHRSLYKSPPSEQRTLWLSLIKEMSQKKSVKSPIHVGINTKNFVCARQLQTKQVSHFCFPNCPSERDSWHSVRLMTLKLPMSLFSLVLSSWMIGMWLLKVAYGSNVSRSLQFVELIITSGTYNVCDVVICIALCSLSV